MLKFVVSFISLFLLLGAQSSFAFVPDDEELTVLLRKSYGPMTSWEADMTFADHPGVTVNIKYNRGKWRQTWQSGGVAEAVGLSGTVVASCTESNFALSPMFVWVVPNPLQTWKSWGIDSANRNYGFCGDHPCFMIGADPGDDSAPTVYLNNEDMAPLLVRYVADGKLISVAYSEYKTLGGYRVPQKIVLTIDGESLEASVAWKSVMKSDSPELYAQDSIPSTLCVDPPAPFDFLRENFRFPSTR